MTVIAIEVAMRHLRAEDFDQPHVELLLAAAEDSAAQYLNRRFYADADALAAAVIDGTAGSDPIVINPSIVAACLLKAGSLYEHREDDVAGGAFSELPSGSKSLLTPYRVEWGV
ncbi:hypothetical protein BI292_06245 [Pseudomonas sp. 43NM1]|uniref:head-tail connector protein n=1 Tax=Pseudomonas sp. 43NM1 TaxID=1904755 RepID=UPI000C32A948|nr:head-tail connector protein [Pseudomonas sp. 43NM1]PKH12606.1 hypothetical protein BI292_06245 [Pseudomonas sp. 43NM1]